MALRTIPGAQIADEPVIGYSSRRNDIRWDSQHHFRMVGGAGHGGGMTDFDIVLVTPFSPFAQLRFASAAPTPISARRTFPISRLIQSLMTNTGTKA